MTCFLSPEEKNLHFLSMCRALGKYFVEGAFLYKQFDLKMYIKFMAPCKIQQFILKD